MDFKIEKNIPCTSFGANSTYEFVLGLEVGDSFLVDSLQHNKVMCGINSLVNYRKSDFKFSCKKWDDSNHRIWRVK